MNPQDLMDRFREMWERRNGPPIQGWDGGLPQLEVAWDDYFKDFCDRHGKFPLMFQGRLLFEDGWMYSAVDHKGPKWPPPEDERERHRLMRSYWKMRRNAIKRELPGAEALLSQIEELIEYADDVPIKHRVRFVGANERGESAWQKEERPLSEYAAGLRQRIEWLKVDLALCDMKIVNPEAEPILPQLEVVT